LILVLKFLDQILLFYIEISYSILKLVSTCVVGKDNFEISNLIKYIIENIILVLNYIPNTQKSEYTGVACAHCARNFNKIYILLYEIQVP
jgi:hypothetical protein